MTRKDEVAGEEENRGPNGSMETGQGDEASQDDELRDVPMGAIAVTTFLAITILVFWFGMYFLNIARSS